MSEPQFSPEETTLVRQLFQLAREKVERSYTALEHVHFKRGGRDSDSVIHGGVQLKHATLELMLGDDFFKADPRVQRILFCQGISYLRDHLEIQNIVNRKPSTWEGVFGDCYLRVEAVDESEAVAKLKAAFLEHIEQNFSALNVWEIKE